MSAFRFACMPVVVWMTCHSVQAQHLPLVQVASPIEMANESDAADNSDQRPPVQSTAWQGNSSSYVLTDDSIDALAIPSSSDLETEWVDATMGIPMVDELTQGECSCGQKHCHGVCRDPGHPKKPWFEKPGDRDRGDCPPRRYRMDDCERAGSPHCYHRWAKCSVDDKYSAWFVGGGSPFPFGRARTSSEGTWGLDYNGGLFGHAKIWLNYTHGRNQGGFGAYRTDGEPKIVSRVHDLLHK